MESYLFISDMMCVRDTHINTKCVCTTIHCTVGLSFSKVLCLYFMDRI